MTDRKIARIVFDPVAEPEADEEGRWWYEEPWGKEIVSYSAMQPHAGTPLRRTVEYEKPMTWQGKAFVQNHRAVVRSPWGALAGCYNPTIVEAKADIANVKAAAELYASRHNAVIKWDDHPEEGESE